MDQVPVHRHPRQHDCSDTLANRSYQGHKSSLGDVRQCNAPGIKSSMLVDVERGNSLEVETFSGTVIRLGSELNVPTPVHRCIYAILKIEDVRNRARRAEKKAVPE